MINDKDKRRKKPDYNPLNKIGDENKFTINLDEVYERRKKRLKEVKDILNDFSSLIKNSFERRKYANTLILILDLAHLDIYFRKSNTDSG